MQTFCSADHQEDTRHWYDYQQLRLSPWSSTTETPTVNNRDIGQSSSTISSWYWPLWHYTGDRTQWQTNITFSLLYQNDRVLITDSFYYITLVNSNRVTTVHDDLHSRFSVQTRSLSPASSSNHTHNVYGSVPCRLLVTPADQSRYSSWIFRHSDTEWRSVLLSTTDMSLLFKHYRGRQ